MGGYTPLKDLLFCHRVGTSTHISPIFVIKDSYKDVFKT
jgi:hypothetical protein